MLEAVVGSAAAERVLLYLQAYEEAYGREIASALGLAQSQVQKQLRKLESGGVLVSRLIGRSRIYTWNPRNPLVPPLRSLFQSAFDTLPKGEQQKYFRGRRRPRRSYPSNTSVRRRFDLAPEFLRARLDTDAAA